MENRPVQKNIFFVLGLVPLLSLLLPLIPQMPGSQAWAIPAWSRKYSVSCNMCHSPAFARLNYFGERFLANGYQHPDADAPDGDTEGKESLGEMLPLDTNVGHWLTARFSVTPIAVETNAQTVEGELENKVTIGNPNWLQLFVAGALANNVSVYIENEFSPDGFHQAWYYLGFQNVGGTTWLNAQVGRLSAVVFAPYPDRLPQLPAVGGGVMRVRSSDGAGESSLDIRSPRYGIQYYGYQGSAMVYAGVTPGSKPSHPGGEIGYWVGGRLITTKIGSLTGSSVGLHFDAGTDTKDSPTTKVKNDYSRFMPSANLRYADKVDVQAAYVIAKDDNWALTPGAEELEYSGVRLVGSYFVSPRWIVSMHYDNFSAKDEDDEALLADYHLLFLPVVTYLRRENLRISLYPGIDLRDVDSDLKRHTAFINIRAAI